jgi:hypothetical protein
MSAYIKRTERSQINDLMLHLKLHEKQEQEKPKTSRRREIIKIWPEINEIVTKNNHTKNQQGEIPRWQLEGGSRKRAPYSEILERRWRHVSHPAGKTTEKRQNFDPSTPPVSAEHLHFMLNREIRRATSCPCPDGLGRRGQGELSGTTVLPQTTLGQSSTAPWTDRPPPGEKRETE